MIVWQIKTPLFNIYLTISVAEVECEQDFSLPYFVKFSFWLSSAHIAYGSNTYYWRIGNPHWLYMYAMNAIGGNLVSQISDHLLQFLIVNHRMIICFFKSVHTTQYGIRLSVTLVPTFEILYLLMLRKSSRFLVFVKISTTLWLMVIIVLLIPEVLWLYYL